MEYKIKRLLLSFVVRLYLFGVDHQITNNMIDVVEQLQDTT